MECSLDRRFSDARVRRRRQRRGEFLVDGRCNDGDDERRVHHERCVHERAGSRPPSSLLTLRIRNPSHHGSTAAIPSFAAAPRCSLLHPKTGSDTSTPTAAFVSAAIGPTNALTMRFASWARRGVNVSRPCRAARTSTGCAVASRGESATPHTVHPYPSFHSSSSMSSRGRPTPSGGWAVAARRGIQRRPSRSDSMSPRAHRQRAGRRSRSPFRGRSQSTGT